MSAVSDNVDRRIEVVLLDVSNNSRGGISLPSRLTSSVGLMLL